MNLKRISAIAGVVALAALTTAQVKFNELTRDVPGGDDTFEYIELKGTPGANLNNLWLLVIEGDGAAAGLIDQAIPLTGQSLGPNGLLLIRDNSLTLLPAPDPNTSIFTIDFNPDIENGAATYAIVSNYNGYVINAVTNPGQNSVVGQIDIDTDNNGVMGDWGVVTTGGSSPVSTAGGVQPWDAVTDAFGVLDSSTATADWEYGNQFIAAGTSFGATFGEAPGSIEFVMDSFFVSSNGIRLVTDTDLDLGTVPAGGPYPIDPPETEAFGCKIVSSDLVGMTYTPGSVNPAVTAIVEPASLNLVQGTPFGGNLASLVNSDDDRYFILNDESDPNAELRLTGAYCGTTASSVKVLIEASASRNDLSTFVDVQNATSSLWTNAAFAVSSLTDVVITGTITQNASSYIATNGNVSYRIRWIPTSDLEAADGWSEQCDLAVLEIK